MSGNNDVFLFFGLISSGGEQVVGIMVYEGTPCLERQSGLFLSLQRIQA